MFAWIKIRNGRIDFDDFSNNISKTGGVQSPDSRNLNSQNPARVKIRRNDVDSLIL